MKQDTILKNFGKKKESSGQSLKLQSAFKNMQIEPEVTKSKAILKKSEEKIKADQGLKERSKNFTFVTEAENLNYLRKLEFAKRQENYEFSQFTVTDVVKEGIVLLRKSAGKMIERPGGLIPTKRGRVANGPELKERMSTSFSLPESDVNFIYDYLFSKSGNVLGGFTKEEFMTDLIKVLKKKYGELK